MFGAIKKALKFLFKNRKKIEDAVEVLTEKSQPKTRRYPRRKPS